MRLTRSIFTHNAQKWNSPINDVDFTGINDKLRIRLVIDNGLIVSGEIISIKK